MKLSVVIPCLNGASTLAAQLEALSRQHWDGGWEVIVVDNGSTDGSQALALQYLGRLPGLRLIEASARRGAAHTRNVGAEAASGEAIVFCDADDEVGENWLAAMGRAFSRHDFIASRMDVEKLNPDWLARRLNNVQGYQLRRMPYAPYLCHAGSSGLGIKKAIHHALGGFDESLAQREDTDYCFRAQLRGVELHFEPDAVIHVRYREQSGKLFRQARLWGSHYALLYSRYGHGMPVARAWASYLLTWRDLIRCAPRLFSREKRPAWMKTLGTQIGLLEGAIRYRVPPICEPAPAKAVETAGSPAQQPGLRAEAVNNSPVASSPSPDTASPGATG